MIEPVFGNIWHTKRLNRFTLIWMEPPLKVKSKSDHAALPSRVGVSLFALIVTMASTHAQTPSIAPVTTVDVVERANGLTEADLDMPSLKRIEAWMVSSFRKNMEFNTAKRWLPPEDATVDIDSKSQFAHAGGKKLGLIELAIEDSIRMVSIVGFVGPDVHRVTCKRESPHDIPVWTGACGEKIKEVFGVSLFPDAESNE